MQNIGIQLDCRASDVFILIDHAGSGDSNSALDLLFVESNGLRRNLIYQLTSAAFAPKSCGALKPA